jgi:uncharacterized membrane protein (DUF4010 family)
LERQRSQTAEERLFAGIRTFPLLVLAGYLGALVAGDGAPLALPAVLLGIGALIVASYLRTAADHVGATTEATAIVAPLLGVLVARGEPLPAMSLAVLITLLLTLKAPLHRIAGSVSETEIVAILKFAIVAVVLLPLLPDTPMGPYGALVPRHLGLVVVTLCGISLAGYLLVRLLGGGAGWPLVGALGGLVSSTAVTLALSAKARTSKALAPPLALGTLLASTVLYVRGLILVALFDRSLAVHLAPRMLGLFAVGGVVSAVLRREQRGETRGEVAFGNPVELSRAVGLGILFAAVLLGVRAAEAELGRAGVWSAGALGGLVDVDSVALAVARLRQQGFVEAGTAANAFLLGTVSNLLVKGAIVTFVGGRAMARLVLPGFALLAIATLALLLV